MPDKPDPGDQRGERAPDATEPLRLDVRRGDSTRSIALDSGRRWTIGRAEDCDIRLNDPTASRRHVVLELRGNIVYFTDLGGTNTTLLNRRPMREGHLPLDIPLVVGMTSLTLRRSEGRTQVRVVDEPNQGSVLLRHHIQDTADPDHPATLDAIRELLDMFARSPLENESRRDVAKIILESTLGHLRRNEGAIGLFSADGSFEILASIRRESSNRDVEVHRQTLDEARSLNRAFVVEPETTDEPEQLIAPFACGTTGLLVLQSRAHDAPPGSALLPALATWAAFTGHRIREVEDKLALRDEISRLRYGRSPSQAELLSSTRLQPIRTRLSLLARHDTPVMLAGEPGTEKEELARFLHAQTPDEAGSFIAFYASVLSPRRATEELFGPETGGDTSLMQAVTGRSCLVRANGGTLFVDQPERLTPEAQQRLVSLLATAANRPFRLVAGSDIDTQGQRLGPPLIPELAAIFAEATLHVPRLADHPDDILSLAELILSNMGPGIDGAPRSLHNSTRRCLIKYDWPNNTNQLLQAIETAAARAGHNPIAPRHLPPEIRDPAHSSDIQLPTLAEVERRHILQILHAVGGSKRQAAQTLGIAISTLYNKLERYKIDT